jgi:hypothetical protein
MATDVGFTRHRRLNRRKSAKADLRWPIILRGSRYALAPQDDGERFASFNPSRFSKFLLGGS